VDLGFWPLVVPVVAIVSGCAVAIIATIARKEVRALEIRERIAMIEKGLVPPPEVDPRGFDRAMNRYERRRRRRGPGGPRHRRSGIMAMAVGFALMALIGIAGDNPRDGIGVGGAFVIFGLAFFISSLFEDSPPSPGDQLPSAQPSAPGPQDAPSSEPPA
jgi:hypothetical protein